MELINIYHDNTIDGVLSALADNLHAVDNDFNGVNGEDFVTPAAIENGYKSDLDYTVCNLRSLFANWYIKTLDEVVSGFLSALFADSDYYGSWTYEPIEHNGERIGVSVAWTVR